VLVPACAMHILGNWLIEFNITLNTQQIVLETSLSIQLIALVPTTKLATNKKNTRQKHKNAYNEPTVTGNNTKI